MHAFVGYVTIDGVTYARVLSANGEPELVTREQMTERQRISGDAFQELLNWPEGRSLPAR